MYPDILLALARAHQRDLLSEAEQARRVRLARAASAQQRRLQATGRAELAPGQISHRPEVTAVDQRAA
jgi:hypothetical protein